MGPERWQRVESIYHSALSRPAGERDAYLAEACAGDGALREEVEALIASHERSGSFIDRPVFDLGVRAMVEEPTMLGAGKAVGHYVILDVIGRGGMGEVYLARDPRLGRKVALKLLPRDLKGDSERVQRFRQEARAASAVSHPNIAHVYDVGEADGLFYTAIEYVEGVTLRQLINEGRVDLRAAVNIAVQIAEALAAAHAAGVVHRDVKPENVMVRHDGYVKVLDFGLAKLVEHLKTNAPGDPQAPTAPMVHSEPGMVMGTVRYMSPEQARGLAVDARTDVWSLGVVLYEMSAGRAPFDGPTLSDTLVQILDREPPPLTEFAPDLPAKLQGVIARTLRKDPAGRYQSADELARSLKELRKGLEEEPGTLRAVAPASSRHASSADYIGGAIRRHRRGVLLGGVLLMLITAGVGYGIYSLKRQPATGAAKPHREMSMAKLTTGGRAKWAAISPDGKYVVYVLGADSRRSLWLRQVGTTRDVQIDPLGEYGRLTLSPDSTHIYYTDFFGDLYQMPILGGAKRKLLARVNSPITFSPEGDRFAFVRDDHPGRGGNSLVIANADGTGEQTLATREGRDGFANARPAWSPDGKSIVCAAVSSDTRGAKIGVVEVRLEGGAVRPISPRRWFEVEAVAWLADGGGLVVVASDSDRMLSPQIWQLSYPDGGVQQISRDFKGYTDLSLTKDSHVLVTVQEEELHNVWIVPEGNPARARQITNGAGTYGDLRWSPDGGLVYASNSGGNWDIWSLRPDGSERKQLTVNAGANGVPMFTPDGRYIVFVSLRAGTANIWRMDADGGNPLQLTDGEWEENPVCSPDGQWVVYESGGFDKHGLWKVSIQGGEPVRLTEGESTLPAISPDGKMIAFGYKDVRAGAQWKVAAVPFEGGQPVRFFDLPVPLFWRGVKWTPDGQSLAYIDARGGISNVWSQPVAGGPPKRLTDFKSEEIFHFDWSRDGKQLAVSRGRHINDVVVISDFR